MIKCKVCNNTFKTITANHIATHDFTVKEYKKKFNLKFIHSIVARKKIGNTKLGNQYTRGKQITMNLVSRNKQRRAVIRFNKLLSTRRIRSKQMIGNKRNLGNRHSKEFKKKFTERMIELWSDKAWRLKMLKSRKRSNRFHLSKK